MKNRRAKKIVTAGMGVLMAASSVNAGSLQIVSAQENVVQQSTSVISPLMISELVADTHQSDQTTASGTDAFEYIEIYNTSDQPVSMDDYRIRNVNGSTLTDWEIPQGTIIQPNEAIVVWVQNEESVKSDEETFRAYYGIEDPDVRIIQTLEQVNGFSNSGERSMQIVVKNTGQIVNAITYNDGTEKAQTKKGIRFAYQSAQVQEQTLAYDGMPTPGVLEADQQLDGTYTIPGAGDASIQAVSSDRITAGESLVISAQWELDSVVTNAYVQSADASKTYAMTYADGVFTAVIPAADLLDTETFAYTVHMSDGVNQLCSETNSVLIDAGDTTIAYASPLLLTEVVPNTDNVGGSDAYEYFEIYNVSDFDIDLSDYHFLYDNGSTVAEWQLEDAITLKAKETLTVWVRNDAVVEAGLTAEDFNTHYGSSLTQGEQLTSVRSDGFSNSGSRKMTIESATGLVMSETGYNASDSSDGSLGVDEAVIFNYDGKDVAVQYDNEVTPGRLADSQRILGEYLMPEKVTEPTVQADAPAVAKENENWTVTMSRTNLTADILKGELNIYKKDSGERVMTVPMTYQEGKLQASAAYNELQDLESFSYDIVISDGVNTAVSTMADASVEGLSNPADKTKAPALVVSEILPDSSNVNGADAYEYIEIYNNSNRDIDLKDYKLYYNYPDNGDNSDVIWWETSESRILKSGDTLVFWIKNGGNDELTADDFNAKFGTSLDSSHLIEISCGGMANSGARGVKIATNVKDNVDYVTYNMNGADNTTADKAITFRSQYINGEFTSPMTADDADPTPGTVSERDKPDYQAELPASVSAPSLSDNTPTSFSSDRDLIFSLDAVSKESNIKTVHLYIKDNNSDSYEMYNLLRENKDTFGKTLTGVDLYGKEYYEYYFEVSDGYQTVRTETKQIKNENPLPQGDQLNVSDNQFLSGNNAIIGTGGNLFIDGQDVSGDMVPSINGDARIAFDTSQTDVFFKNAVAIGDHVLGIFNEGTYDTWATYDYDVDESYFDSETGRITIAFHAGNKANALEHDIENNDDFVLKNIRLILPDGVSLRPVSYQGVYGIGAIEHTADNWHPQSPVDLGALTPENEISMGDGTSKVEILYVTFQLEKENFNAVRYDLDTTALTDGVHTITSGTKTVNVIVDNTAPEITTNIEEGAQYREQELKASASDALSENVTLTAALDGEEIGLPYTISSKVLDGGTHTLVLTATDEAGNTSEKTVSFEIPEENAYAENTSPEDGTTVHGNPTLSVKVTDPTDDQMTVAFKKGERYELGDAQIKESAGISSTAGTAGNDFGENTGNGFPWQIFEIQAGENADKEDEIRVQWQGISNNAKTFMYVYKQRQEAGIRWTPNRRQTGKT